MNKNLAGPARGPFLALLIAASVAACGGQDSGTGMQPLPVEVTEAVRRDVPLIIDMVGTTRGAQDVPIRARVEGFLESIHFEEGRFVEAGQLLYTIDPQPFRARVVEAESQLAAARTALAKAESDLARIRPLAEMQAVSQQELDAAIAQYEAAQAGVKAAQAAVELARIELSYTEIRAPIAGLIGLSRARPGEFVGREPNPVVLNTLSDIDPIRVRFSISEREYLILARTMIGEAKRSPEERQQRELTLILADGSVFEHRGRLSGAAQAIDLETGTYPLEATFPNPDGLLLPGQFARVQALYETLEDVVVVPRRAVVELQGLFQVYVVQPDNSVELRRVQPGPVKDGLQVIESGLEGGETVIVEGMQRLRPGMQVAPAPWQPADNPPPPQPG